MKTKLAKIYILLSIILIFSLMSIPLFQSLLGSVIYLVALFLLISAIVFSKIKINNLIYILVVTIYVCVSCLLNGGNLGSIITFVLPILLFLIFSEAEINKKETTFLKYFCFFGLIVLFCYSFPYSEGYRSPLFITLNPNTLGMFIMYFFMIISVLGEYSKKRNKIFIILLFFMSIEGMYNYQSRGTVLALVFFALLMIAPSSIYNDKIITLITIAVILIGTIFPFIYLNLYKNGYSLEMFGKDLYTGREKLWLTMFNLFNESDLGILIGLGSDTVLVNTNLNVHNNFFNIIVNFGVIGYMLYYGFIIVSIKQLAKNSGNCLVRKGIFMFICSALVLGFTETTTLWLHVFPFVYFGLILANVETRRILILDKNYEDKNAN